MGKHCGWCRIYNTDCLCNTCQRDELLQNGKPACCAANEGRVVDAEDNCSGVHECPHYERESKSEQEEVNP